MRKTTITSLAIIMSLLMALYLFPADVAAVYMTADADIENNVNEQPENQNNDQAEKADALFEMTELRTSDTKYVRMSDGTIQALVYDTAVHAKDETGKWQEIDNRLTEKDGKVGSDRVTFEKKITNGKLFTLRDGDKRISLSISGSIEKAPLTVVNDGRSDAKYDTKLEEISTITKSISSVRYNNVFPSTDLEYVLSGEDVKENIVINQASDSYNFTFSFELVGLTAKAEKDGSIVLYDGEEIAYTMPAPYMYDAEGAYSDAVSYALDGNTITVSADPVWINDESRSFPVVVDPTIFKGGHNQAQMADTFVSSKKPTTNYGYNTSLRIGYDGTYGITRSYIALKVLPDLPGGYYLTGARLYLPTIASSNATSSLNIGAYAIDFGDTTLWNEHTVNWNTHPAHFAEAVDYAAIDFGNLQCYYSWDITAIAKEWYNETPNFGIALELVDESIVTSTNYITFASSEHTMNNSSTYIPYYSFSFSDGKGTESYYSYLTTSAGLAGTGHINSATGALTLKKSLLSTTDSLLPYTPTLVYNSSLADLLYQYPNAQTAYASAYMPAGFKCNMQETIIKKSYLAGDNSTDYYYIWADGDGTEHYFYKKEGSYFLYIDEDGLQLKMDVEYPELTITDRNHTTRTYTAFATMPGTDVLGAWYLTSIEDKSGNTVSFTFDTNKRPVSVCMKPNGGTSITFLTISYNSSSMPYMILNDTTKEAIIFRYSETAQGSIATSNTRYLRRLDYAHGNANTTAQNWLDFYNNENVTSNITKDASVLYTYNSTGYLTVARDQLSGYAIQFVYNNSTAMKRVRHIREYGANDTLGQKVELDYGYGYTTVRSSGEDDVFGSTDDLLTKYIFDERGRTITTYTTDLTEKVMYGAASGKYEEGNENAVNSLKQVTTASAAAANYILNASFEKSDSAMTNWLRSSTTTANIYTTSGEGLDRNKAQLSVSGNSQSYILQYVFLEEGDYTLSAETVSPDASTLTITLEAYSMINGGVNESQKITCDRIGSLEKGYDYLTFHVSNVSNGGDRIRIRIRARGSAATPAGSYALIDNVMLTKTSGAMDCSIVNYGNFEESSQDSNGNTRYTVSNFWSYVYNGGSFACVDVGAPFSNVLQITGSERSYRLAEQTVYTAPSAQPLSKAQVFKFSGFAKANCNAHEASEGAFAINLVVNFYDNAPQQKEKLNLNTYCDDWQFVTGALVIPAGKKIQSVKVQCEYTYHSGTALFDNISVTWNPDNDVTRYEYYDDGNVKLAVNGSNAAYYTYNNSGDVTSMITNTGKTTYTYDSNHRLTKEKLYEFDGTFDYELDESAMLTALGNLTLKTTTTNAYNTYGLCTQTTVTSSEETSRIVTKTSYNLEVGSKIFGSTKTTTDALNKVTSYFYDEDNGRLLATTAPDGKGVCYEYDAIGNLLTVHPATYSSNTWQEVTGSASADYVYNSLNQLASITTQSTTYTFTYDVYGNELTVSAGNNTLVTKTYNGNNGKLASLVYGNGNTAEYEYDVLDRLTKIEYNNSSQSDARVYRYEYDSNGRMSRYIDEPEGTETVYRYNAEGKMLGFVTRETNSANELLSLRCAYDEQSRLTSAVYGLEYLYDDTSTGRANIQNSYSYNNNGTLSSYEVQLGSTSYEVTPTYDGFLRTASKVSTLGNASETVTFDYAEVVDGNNNHNTSTRVSQYTTTVQSTKTYNYTYDNAGRITKITDANGSVLEKYTYDSLGQLTREDSTSAGMSIVYAYDHAGNITSKKTYAFSTGTLGTVQSQINYGYAYSNTGDRMIQYDGHNISYDTLGNPTSYYNGSTYSMTWVKGRQLETLTHGNDTLSFTYNADGLRTSKTVNGTEHTYQLDGSRIISEAYAGKLLLYFYDDNGAPLGFAYREDGDDEGEFEFYLYQKNLFGDIIGIYNENGAQVAWYEYDAWGNLTYGSYTSGNSYIYNANPFRYRGYYYDKETGFYYLQTRYYDSVTCRFINGDCAVNANGDLLGFNMFAYCSNNPVMFTDPSGQMLTYWDEVTHCTGGAPEGSFCCNPPPQGTAPHPGGDCSGSDTGSKILEDVKNANILNNDEDKVIDSNYFSFYRGQLVVREDWSITNRRSFSFGIMFLNYSETDQKTVQHEWGHFVHLLLTANPGEYLLVVGLPSINTKGSDYYSKPWERVADCLGGVDRGNYKEGSLALALCYLAATIIIL